MLLSVFLFSLIVTLNPTVALAPAAVAITIAVTEPESLEGQQMCIYVSDNEVWRSSCWPFLGTKRTTTTIKGFLEGQHRIWATLSGKRSNVATLEVH